MLYCSAAIIHNLKYISCFLWRQSKNKKSDHFLNKKYFLNMKKVHSASPCKCWKSALHYFKNLNNVDEKVNSVTNQISYHHFQQKNCSKTDKY